MRLYTKVRINLWCEGSTLGGLSCCCLSSSNGATRKSEISQEGACNTSSTITVYCGNRNKTMDSASSIILSFWWDAVSGTEARGIFMSQSCWADIWARPQKEKVPAELLLKHKWWSFLEVVLTKEFNRTLTGQSSCTFPSAGRWSKQQDFALIGDCVSVKELGAVCFDLWLI